MDGTVGTIRGIAALKGERRLRRMLQLAPELVAILSCVAVIWGAVAFTLWQANDAAIDSAQRETATLARAFAESSARISTVLDRELLTMRANLAEKGDTFNLTEWVRTQSSPDHMILQLSFTDRDGVVVQQSVPMGSARIDLADREHFRVHLDPARDAVFISKPVVGRFSKQCSVQYTRKILDRDGGFAGVGINSVSCEDLSRFYQSADTGDGIVMLAGLDGVVRGYGPPAPGLIGMDLSGDVGFEPALSTPEGTMAVSAPWDHIGRIISFRRLDHYPLVVLVGYDNERVFRQYRQLRNRAIEIGGAVTLIIASLGMVWIQQRMRSAASRRALLLTLENMSQGIVMVDADGRIPVVNRRATELLGLPATLLEPGREMRQAEAHQLGLLTHTGEGEAGGIESGDPENGTVYKNGRIIETFSQHLPDGGLVRTFTDVTERRIADARIRHMAHHDSLTGLANRALLRERLEALLRQPDAGVFGLVCLDLDAFKTVNDTLGHEAGDRLLGDVSRRLQGLVTGGALLARTGGDEFAILCPEDAGSNKTMALARAVAAAMTAPIDIDGTQFRVSASLGLAFYPEDGTTAVELIRRADTAMYQAKARGRGLVVRFDAEMDRDQNERCLIERDLRRAMSDNEIEVWFQPRFETRSRRISGFEALARWRHPEQGFISPARFIPVAEQCGMIAELGLRVLEDACVFAASLPDGRIAVNLSPVQFLSENLPEVIGDALVRHNLTSDRLELEITEGVLIADETQALRILRGLRDRNLHIALDDFGTGYASLSYLRRFPFDRIKIDQSFVQAQEHDDATRAIVESILTMARRLRLEVTAEGVETESQLNLLAVQGCPEVQGYLLGRPMPAAEARAFYVDHKVPARKRELSAA
jgi:diguanylate cyclase (GGDEF)-like protein